MPKFTIVALEKFTVKTTYENVEADTLDDAIEACKVGEYEYSRLEPQEGDEKWLQPLLEECEEELEIERHETDTEEKDRRRGLYGPEYDGELF